MHVALIVVSKVLMRDVAWTPFVRITVLTVKYDTIVAWLKANAAFVFSIMPQRLALIPTSVCP